MSKKLPEPAFARPHGAIRQPQHIEFEAWARLPAAERAPERGVAMLELRDGESHCLVVDAQHHQPLYLFAVETARLAEVLRVINTSGRDGHTGVVVGGPSFICPPFCVKSGIGNKPDPGGGGGGGDDPGVLMVRAKLIERALRTRPEKVSLDGAAEVEAIVLRD
jgi:hypothetical protein